MRRPTPAVLLAILLAAPAASAIGNDPADGHVPEVVRAAPADPTPGVDASLRVEEVAVEARTATDGAASAQCAERGSFWWVVGVIVVAGVILAVLL